MTKKQPTADYACAECGRDPCKYSTKTARHDRVTRETCLVGPDTSKGFYFFDKTPHRIEDAVKPAWVE